MSGVYRSKYVSPSRTRKSDNHEADKNGGGIQRTKSFQPTDTLQVMNTNISTGSYSSLEDAWRAMRTATVRVQNGDEAGRQELKAATRAVKKIMTNSQQEKQIPQPPLQPQVPVTPMTAIINKTRRQERDQSIPPPQYWDQMPSSSPAHYSSSTKSKRHSSPPRRKLQETNKIPLELTAYNLGGDDFYPVWEEERKSSPKQKKQKDKTNRKKDIPEPQPKIPSRRLEFVSEPSDKITDVQKPDMCTRKGAATPGDKVRGPPQHTPPKGNMIDEALRDVNMKSFTPAPKPFVMDLNVDISEALRENNTAKRLPAAIPLNKMKPVPLAVQPFIAADPIDAPEYDKKYMDVEQRNLLPVAGISSKQPPIMECYLVELSPSGAPQYHQRFLHFHGSSQIVFSKSVSGGTDPTDFTPREDIAVTSLLSFAPATKDGTSSHQGMEWFVITTTFTEYQAVAVDPKLLRDWVSWLSSRHPLIQTGSTSVVLH